MGTYSHLQQTAQFARFATIVLAVFTVIDFGEWIVRNLMPSLAASDTFVLLQDYYRFSFIPLIAGLCVNGRWIFVAARHYQSRADATAPIRPHWAVWSNLIPVANIFTPFIQLRRIYAVAQKGGDPAPKWLWIWWIAWITPFLLSAGVVFSLTLWPNQEIIENGFSFGQELYFLAALVLDLIATILFLRLINQISHPKLSEADVFS